MNNYFISLIRTLVPMGAGLVFAYIATHFKWFALSPQESAAATAWLVALASGVYYAVVRALETRFHWVGVLLGHLAKPDYHRG